MTERRLWGMTLDQMRATNTSGETRWLWHGLIARGSTTLFSSQWKSGKTTLLSLLLARMDAGGTLAGREVAPGSAAVVSEEAPALWLERGVKLRIGKHVTWFCRPFVGPPGPDDWDQLLGALLEAHRDRSLHLVSIDPLAAFLPRGSENDAATMMQVVASLRALTDLGIAVVLVHHPAKGRRIEGQSPRGSGALAAAVDILIEMSQPADPESARRRRLRAWSRYDDTPAEMRIELNEAGDDYELVEHFGDDDLPMQWELIDSVLDDNKKLMTRKQIRDDWPEDYPRPDATTLWRWLEAAVSQGRLQRLGDGKKNSPFRYWPAHHEQDWRTWWIRQCPWVQDHIIDELLGLAEPQLPM